MQRAPDGTGLSAERLWSTLQQLRPLSAGPLRCAVAWSGGLDSTVLLHLMLALRRAHPRRLQVRAVHVDHHLQEAAAQFRAHCVRWARRWRVPLAVLDAEVRLGRGASLEEAAREARQRCWRATLRQDEWLLLAQHADDQVETTLLALLRGAGPAGLAAMPQVATLGAGKVVRPLLMQPRAALRDYARLHQLPHVEDPTNDELRFDRNFLRAEVVPRLRQRWPGITTAVPRSARHCAAAAAVLARDAAHDLGSASDGADLEMAVLRRWPLERVNAVLRAWFASAGLRSPETRHLRQIQGMLTVRPDARPELRLEHCVVRAHAGRLSVHLPAAVRERARPWRQPWQWRRGALSLPQGGQLAVVRDPHGDLDLARLPARLTVGLAAALPELGGRKLRKQLQELQVPLWERECLPLLVRADGAELLAVGDLWLHESVRSAAGSSRRGRIVWRPQA